MPLALSFITLGMLFMAGLVADRLGRRTRLPRVTLLLGTGLLVGQAGFDLLPEEIAAWYDFLATAALTMVAFLLGGALDLASLRRHGRAILWISLSVVALTLPVVAGVLWALGMALPVALALGGIATATDPAATEDALRQGGAEAPEAPAATADQPDAATAGPTDRGTATASEPVTTPQTTSSTQMPHPGAAAGFKATLRGVVAIDDAWGMVAFSLAMVAARVLAGEGDTGLAAPLLEAAWEIGGALLLGLALGLPAAALTGRLTPGEPLQSEALGVVFLTAGLALWLDVSFLLAGMVAGAVVVNLARHHDHAFHEIEHVQWPFMILFFVLAGASLEPAALAGIGLYGLGFVAARVAARVAGGWIGATLGAAPRGERGCYGAALLPQAGVAVGMALVAAAEFPEAAELILSLTVAATVVFEMTGPMVTLWALRRVARRQGTGRASGAG